MSAITQQAYSLFTAPVRVDRVVRTIAGAMLAVLLGCGVWWIARTRSDGKGIAPLVASTSELRGRFVEARLSGGFAWAPYDPASPRSAGPVLSAAASVLSATRAGSAADGPHASAVAYLLLDRASDAVKLLDPAAPKLGDARVWSDLAAAHYHAAVTGNDPQRLGAALAAADAALRVDSALPEALFNRALILERFGLRDLAREGWERYVAADPASAWADEARQRIESLQPVPPFRDVLAREYDKLAADAAAAHAFARRYRQEARTWGETEILARWATAELANDGETARKHLRIARELGAELARDRGDRMLAGAVAAIDRADFGARKLLASGHVAFRDGQKTYRGNKASAAHPLFLEAVEGLRRGGSPVELLARYFAANTAYDQGRVAEATATHERLLATAPADFPAHRAQLQWQLGRAYMLDGRWGDALATLAEGVSGFERLGEWNYAATVREIRAEVYDRIGDPVNAWRERVASMQELGRQLTPRLLIAISSMSRVAMVAGEWQQAASFLAIELEVCRRVATPMRRVEMLLLRAQLNHRLGQAAAARADLKEARAEIVRLNDPALSSLMEEEAVSVDALLAPSPAAAVQLLTTAIASYQPRGRRVFLPEALLQRGRAYVALGDRAAAAADFEAGIVELETGREALPGGESRWGILSSVDDLFEEAISLSLARGDARTALSYAERARARQLLDELEAGSLDIATEDVPPDTVIVEYVALEKRLVIFVIGPEGVRATEQAIGRQELAARAARFAAAIRKNDRDAARLASAGLQRVLVDPIAADLARRKPAVVVRDPVLSGVAFAAIADAEGRYWIERNELVISPSAAVFLRLLKRQSKPHTARRLLLVANPRVEESAGAPLILAGREAEAISSLYDEVTTLAGERATVAAFTREAPSATVIHFAGHAIAEGGRKTALLLATAPGSSGRADAAAIAALRLRHTEVVVLAACDTANGEINPTEGTISVARAFLAAGVPSAIATIQPIDDAGAALFFPRVHEHLARGAEPAEALRAVQLEWIQRGDANIATWAAIQAIGR